MTREKPVVALDGPSGAGKSSIARALAEQLAFIYVDTGALYRGIALIAKERGISWEDPEALGQLSRSSSLSFDSAARLHIEGVDRSEEIRTPEIAQGASKVSAHETVRKALLDIQRNLGKEGGVVLEGRDIGTVVFPDAEIKIFLTASPEERAKRRTRELKERGSAVDYDELLNAMRERDKRDSSRAIAPLKPAEDAEVVDSSKLDFEETLRAIVEIVHKSTPCGT